MTNTSQSFSHSFPRQFRPEHLRAPRGFTLTSPPQTKLIYLEIGAGKGRHALQFAAANCNSILFAIERTKSKFSIFSERAELEKLNNLIPVHADAIPWTVFTLGPNTLNGVFILYPNPEPGNTNQRWINMPFFEFLLSRLKPESSICLASNIWTYIEETLNKAEQIWKLKTELESVPNDSQRTHFEIKYLSRGEQCWQLNIKKPAAYITRFDDYQQVLPNDTIRQPS